MKVRVEFDHSELKGKIIAKYGSMKNFCDVYGMSRTFFSQKMNNKSDFTSPQIYEIAMLVGIPLTDIPDYFFKPLVSKS